MATKALDVCYPHLVKVLWGSPSTVEVGVGVALVVVAVMVTAQHKTRLSVYSCV